MLSLELDGRLDPAAAARLADHVSACGSCARSADSLVRTWRRIGALGAVPPAPDDFWRIVARTDRRAGRWHDVLRLVLGRPLVSASVAAGLLLGSTAGFALASAAFASRSPAVPAEVTLLAEGFGDLPFDSPAARMARAFTDREVWR